MGDPSYLEKMGGELKCPICLSLLNSAVSLVSCNHVFCNACILKSMKSGSDCPVCKVPYRRREVRPAPQMDNLVSIYKSMEAASGFNIFVTQNTSSSKLADEQKQETHKNCSREDIGSTAEPSFPAKKRVQVPQFPLSETPAQSVKIETGSDKSNEVGLKNSSVPLKKNPPLKEQGGSGLAPFFWLRDEENADNLSQHTDEDQLLDVTPPDVPTFSDIKGLDDESPFKSSPPGELSDKLDVAHLFDSEMFEWTQRPCSPELFSSPVKMQGGGADEFDEAWKRKSGLLSTRANKNMKNKKAVNTKQQTDNADGVLPTVSSPKANGNNSQMKHGESNKRHKNSKKPAGQKGAKKNVDQGLEVPIESKMKPKKIAQKEALDRGCSSLNSKKNSKRTKKARLLACATESKPEDVPPSSEVEETVNLDDEGMDSELLVSSVNKPDDDEGFNMKRNGKSVCRKISKEDQNMEFSLKSKKRKLETMEIIAEKVLRIQNQIKKDANPRVSPLPVLGVKDTNISSSKDRLNKNGRQDKSASSTECNQNLRCAGNRKVSSENPCGLVNNTQDQHVLVSAKENQPSLQVSNVSEKETQSCGKVLGSSTPCILNNSQMLGSLCQPNEVSLRRCTTLTNENKCAFCLSSHSSEASGEMVNYFNGRPVVADFDGGSKVIHAHRNCTEWAPNVYFEGDIAINLEAELARSRRIRCCSCGLKGAALGCYEKSCRKSFHVSCAKLIPQCRWDTDNFVMLCPLHAFSKLPCEDLGTEEDLGIQERKKKKCFPEGQMVNHCNQIILKSNISTSPNRKSFIGAEKLVLCCSAVTNVERELVSEFERLSGVKVLKNWDLKVTHVIASSDESGACKRTLKVLKGILEGKWILNIKWLKACMSATKLVEEEPYEINVDIHGIRDGPQLGRLRILNKQPRIFEGLKFYFMGDFMSSYKGYLQELLIAGGGTILHRKPISEVQDQIVGSSTFIVYSNELPDKCDPSKKNIILSRRQADAEDLASATGAKALSNLWILDCIAGCKLQDIAE